jgi:hypothetical protein
MVFCTTVGPEQPWTVEAKRVYGMVGGVALEAAWCATQRIGRGATWCVGGGGEGKSHNQPMQRGEPLRYCRRYSLPPPLQPAVVVGDGARSPLLRPDAHATVGAFRQEDSA